MLSPRTQGGQRVLKAALPTSSGKPQDAGVSKPTKTRLPLLPSPAGPERTHICAEGRYIEVSSEKRKTLYIGPGWYRCPRIWGATREAGDAKL